MNLRTAAHPSRTALTAFALALGVTTAGAIIVVQAIGGDAGPASPAQTPTPAADWTPADAAPQVEGLQPIDPADVPEEGLVMGRLRVLPAGSVPGDAYSFELEPGEQMQPWDPAVSMITVEPSEIVIPESAEWTVDRGLGGMVTTGESPRLVQESVTIRPV